MLPHILISKEALLGPRCQCADKRKHIYYTTQYAQLFVYICALKKRELTYIIHDERSGRCPVVVTATFSTFHVSISLSLSLSLIDAGNFAKGKSLVKVFGTSVVADSTAVQRSDWLRLCRQKDSRAELHLILSVGFVPVVPSADLGPFCHAALEAGS